MNITLLNYLSLAYFLTPLFGTCSSLYITLYFVGVCIFAFVSQPFTIPFLAFSVLHWGTVLTVIRFLVPFHLHILYLTLASSHFELLFQTFWNLYNIGYSQTCHLRHRLRISLFHIKVMIYSQGI